MTATNDSSVIYVLVTPGARKEAFIPTERADTFRASVREPAARNQANARVRELVAVYFHVPTTAVRMVAGHRGARKRLSITT